MGLLKGEQDNPGCSSVSPALCRLRESFKNIYTRPVPPGIFLVPLNLGEVSLWPEEAD